MILAGLCDLLDGPVARLQNRVSLFGAFLDSILDRYADLMLFLGLLVYYVHVNRFRYALLAGAAMAGAVMVSYAKARAESLVPGRESVSGNGRNASALVILGALANRMPLVLWILAIGPNITVIHHIVHTWKQTEGGQLSLDDVHSAVGVSPSPFAFRHPSRCRLLPRPSHPLRRPRRLVVRTRTFPHLVRARSIAGCLEQRSGQGDLTAMPKLIATVGGLIICAGIDLLWQSRHQIHLLRSKPSPTSCPRSGGANCRPAFFPPARISCAARRPCGFSSG